MVPIATGSQTAGSVIRPAAYCGVAGFKPSYKLIPTIGVKCYAWSLDTIGLYGAGVADVAFATAAMSGRDLRVDRATPTAPRVALVRTHIWADASTDMQNAVDTAARALEGAGASVKEVALPPLLQDAWRADRRPVWPRPGRAGSRVVHRTGRDTAQLKAGPPNRAKIRRSGLNENYFA